MSHKRRIPVKKHRQADFQFVRNEKKHRFQPDSERGQNQFIKSGFSQG